MKNIQNMFAAAKRVLTAASLIVVLAQCANEEEIIAPSEDIATQATSTTSDEEVGSLSVQGLYTELRESVDCATCTFVVDKRTKTVDGKELGLKPGSIICLQKNVRYQSIDFVNVEGTEENPIVISYCAN